MKAPSAKTIAAYVAATTTLQRRHNKMLGAMRAYMAQLAIVKRYESRLDRAARAGLPIGGTLSPSDLIHGNSVPLDDFHALEQSLRASAEQGTRRVRS